MGWREVWPLFRDSFRAFNADEGQRRGAALAFFSIFSLSPLFVVALAIASFWYGRDQAREGVFGQLSDLLGEKGAASIQALVENAEPAQSGWAAVLALGALFTGATIVFVELHASLNAIWKVQPRPGRSLVSLVRIRVLSFAVVLTIGFLLLVSLMLSAVLAAFSHWLGAAMPGLGLAMTALEIVVSLGIITLLFALIFKVLPDAVIAWGDVWVGSLMTALLFTIGKTLIGLYLGRATVISAYGAAGSFVVTLLWIYYSAQIFFFGAEFSALYANRFGSHVKPAPGAERAPDGTCETGTKGVAAKAGNEAIRQ